MEYYVITEECTTCPVISNRNYLEKNYPNYEIKELPEDYNYQKYIIVDGELVLNPDYDEGQILRRKANFESQFMLTSKGNYRLNPKGYANAQQSIDTVDNIVSKAGSLPAQYASKVIFYATPDFSKPEECTEEWLVNHQTTLQAMTKEEWDAFYLEFTTLYAEKQYITNNLL